MKFRALLAPLLLAACSGSDGTPTPPVDSAEIRLQQVADGFQSPVHLTTPPGDERLFIVEQHGRIRIIENGRVVPTPFLDITDKVSRGGEQGLLSMAFHPRYAQNGQFYLNYTDVDGDTHIERYRVGTDRNRADRASASTVIRIHQPYANHNGGLVAFGPDGMLFIGMGDGGGGGDPDENGQDNQELLGKLLRIDVNGTAPYSIPADNPLRHGNVGRAEIWATGLRNPWRFSFDREQGLLYVADVGQNRLEEVNVVNAAQGAHNYGWDDMEGSDCFEPRTGCDRRGKTTPVYEYTHDEGCSVTGGFAYRGRAIPALRGRYFFADFCQGWVRSFRWTGGETVSNVREWDVGDVGNITSFGEDANGELYVLSSDGVVYRIVPAS